MNIEKPRSDSRLSVVVVGGGIGGAEVSRGLSTKLSRTRHRLILVTARPYFTYLPSSLRVLSDPNASLSTLFMPYDKIFGKFPGEVRVGTVTSVEENKDPLVSKGGIVVLDGGETIMYDVLVIATGSAWSDHLAFPNKEEAFKQHISGWRDKIGNAQNIIIAGGGAVGIEISGEIKDVYPTKNITIVQANNLLLGETYPEKFRVDLERRVQRRDVNIIFNDTIEGRPDPKGTLATSKGISLPCDLIIYARGGRPNTTIFNFLQPSVLSDRGYVKVNSKLQVHGHHNIFALGDIIDWPEPKQLTKILFGHAPVVISNVMSYLEGRPLKKEYTKSIEIMAVSIGKAGGASYLGYLWGLTFGGYFTRYFKSSDLMVGNARRNIGLPSKNETKAIQKEGI